MRRRSTPFDDSILKGIRILCYALLLVLLCMLGYWIGGKLTLVLNKAPAWEEAILMEEEELLDAVRDVPLQILLMEWGDPIGDADYEYESYRKLVWKAADSLDHITLYLDKETQAVLSVEVTYVFEAYPVYSVPENMWGTVTPCPGEDELDYGSLIRINFAGRQAVYTTLDPELPVRIYYKGKPHHGENGGLPYIDTVIGMNYYDYTLEPTPEFDEEK